MFELIELDDSELNVVCGGDSKSMGQVAKKVIGGATDPSAAISHSGPSAPNGFSPNDLGAVGYQVPGFAFQPNGQFGGGGQGSFFPPAQAGEGGYALLTW